MWSTVAAMLASTAGWRYVFPVTSTPTWTRSTHAAMPAIVVQPSRRGDKLRSPSGMKWSGTQTPSHPVRSACAAVRTSSLEDCSIASQMLNRMRRGVTARNRAAARPRPPAREGLKLFGRLVLDRW